MNAAAREWVKRLESGEFKQTTGVLSKGTTAKRSYCCLGLACEISGKGKWTKSGVYGDDNGENTGGLAYTIGEGDDKNRMAMVLPLEVAKSLGLNDQRGEFKVNKTMRAALEKMKVDVDEIESEGNPIALTSLNDAGVSFKDIATIIRMEPKGLFKTRKKSKK